MAQSIELTVTGMKCGGCETNVKNKLGALEGVISVTASSKEKKVNVEYDAAKTDLDAIKAAITEAGFSVD
jgi:copper chaperone